MDSHAPLRENTGDKSRDAGVPRSILGGRKDYRQTMETSTRVGHYSMCCIHNTIVPTKCGHGQTEVPKWNQTEPKAMADDT